MDRDQLIQRLRARVRRGGPAEQVWWNGELLHVSEAIVRAAELDERETIRARGDAGVIPSMLRDDGGLVWGPTPNVTGRARRYKSVTRARIRAGPAADVLQPARRWRA